MVNVQGQNVLIHGLDHHEVLVAFEVQLDNGVGALVTQDGVEFQDVHVYVHWLQVQAVDNHGDAEIAAQAACSALTELVTWLSCKNSLGVSHVSLLILSFSWGPAAVVCHESRQPGMKKRRGVSRRQVLPQPWAGSGGSRR